MKNHVVIEVIANNQKELMDKQDTILRGNLTKTPARYAYSSPIIETKKGKLKVCMYFN